MKHSVKYVCAAAALATALIIPASAQAIGILVPTASGTPPLEIVSHRVAVDINGRTAETKVIQVFKNSTARMLEATYVFPLPKGAVVSDFALWMDGKRVKGEVLEAEKARTIYLNIVRRMKDPGLLEYMGGGLFKARIFPVPAKGEQKVEISFTTVLGREKGISHYVYPLRTAGPSARTLADFTMTVDLHSKVPIKSVYSPTHSVAVRRKGDHHAVAGFEYDRAVLERDFHLYYSLSERNVGVDVMTYKSGDKPGYFMLLATPKQDWARDEILGKHVTFVIDTSGSMRGEPLARARKALVYCLKHLRDDDSFSIVRFSSDVESFDREPRPATRAWVEKAVAFVMSLEAGGGTAIHEALLEALKTAAPKSGPEMVVFLTDGSPTVGETDPTKIAESVARANSDGARIFSFGVGDSVNAVLLDRIAADGGGFAEYVKPDAELEKTLTGFYDKFAHPVLADVELSIPGVKTFDVFPRKLGDLYRGQQVLLFGRYRGSGATVIKLLGTMDGAPRRMDYEGEFAAKTTTADFIPRLWATRKVGHLLEEMRLHGEDKELEEELIRLAKEFGILTPYTSYLVVEETTGPVATPAVPTWSRAGESAGSAAKGRKVAAKPGAAKRPRASYDMTTGSEAIAASKATRDKKDASKAVETGLTKYVDGRTFLWNGATWIDSRFKPAMKLLRIAPMSDAYFALVSMRPDLTSILSRGSSVTVVVATNRAVIIAASGKASIPDKTLRAFVE